jgi:PilZ domain
MPTAPALVHFARIREGRRTDPRAHRRYPISLSVHYKLVGNGPGDLWGSGQTLNLSTGGAYLECADALPPKGPIELVMSWPFLLEGVCPLNLVMRGRIVRVDGRCIAVQAQHHEFRTAGLRFAEFGRA